MWYFTGVSTPQVIEHARKVPLGIMLQPDNHYERLRQSYRIWAVDNGCFSKKGRFIQSDDSFDTDAFLEWIAKLAELPAKCQFVVAPDVVGDAKATLARSLPIMPKIRALGLPVAFVAQDGLEDCAIPWDEFDVLFIGGSTAWKLSIMAAQIVREAKAHGKWVHMGRVNSQRRFTIAQNMGCDSCDGTFLRFGPTKNLPKLLRWIGKATATPSGSGSMKPRRMLPVDPRQAKMFRPASTAEYFFMRGTP